MTNDHDHPLTESRQGVLAMRLVLSMLHRDGAAVDTITDELGECGQCWRRVAWRLAELIAALMTAAADAADLDGQDAAARLIEGGLLAQLDKMGDER